MDGVTILNTIERAITETPWSWKHFWIVFFISLGAMIFIGFMSGLSDGSCLAGSLAGLIIGVICGILFGILAGNILNEVTVDTVTQYEVTIDDSVSMNEFTDKYNIIEQRGKIYIVEEKE